MAVRDTTTDQLTREVVELIGGIVSRYHADYEKAAARHALTGAQARVLALLAPGPSPMRGLAEQLRCEPSNVTGIVDRLESQGLVERNPSPEDRRVKLAAATPAGLRTALALRASLEDFAQEPLAALSRQERTAVRDLLRRLLDEPATRAERPR